MEAESTQQPPPHPSEDKKIPGFWHAILLTVIFFAINISLGVLGAIAMVVSAAILRTNSQEFISQWTPWFTGIANLITFTIVLTIGLFWAKRRPAEAFPARRISAQLIPAIVMIGFGSSILCSEIDNLIQSVFPKPEFLLNIMKQLMQPGLGSFLAIVIVAPLTEELFFRGFLHSGFEKRYSPTKTILLTSVLFAVFHINPYQLPIAFLGGLVLSWLRLRTGSLTPCILLHVAINGLATGIQYLPVKIPGYNLTVEHSFQPWWWDLTGIGLFAIGLIGAHRVLRSHPAQSSWEGKTNLPIKVDIQLEE